MRKKICIATPVDYGNFGNRLQNYAVHTICKKMGMEPVTLAVEYSFVCGKIPKHCILELIHTFHIGNLISKVNRLKSINKSYASWLFTKETIKTVYVENQDELNRVLTQSAYFGIGGDQIFAPYWNEIVWFSMFPECNPNSKICFSPSFGTDSPDRDYLNKIKPELQGIGHLAVREESGCRIAKDLTGKNALRICDPVVMLSKADWIRAAARKEVPKKEKISLVYFLGEYQEKYFPKVENEAQKNGWYVVDVSRSSKSREAACDPLTFVAYINSAECVYTDSFHAIMLALILNKRVVIFERAGGKEMNTRITELVERYKLQNCVYRGNESLEKLGTYNIDEANKVLENERASADDYYKQFTV